MQRLFNDVRYGLRVLIKDWRFTIAAAVLLGLGIGANTAVFTMVRSVLLRQLPLRNAGRLVWIWSTRTDRDKAFFSIPNFLDTRERVRSLEDIAAFSNWGANLTGTAEAERLAGVRISANAFKMLGVDPALGRTILPSDGTPSSERVAMITSGLWRRRFGADSRIIGQGILLNGASFTVIGVLPPDFSLPNVTADVAVPLIFETDPQRSDRGTNFLRVFALTKPGIPLSELQSELASVTEQLKREYPVDNTKHTAPRVLMLQDELLGNYRAILWMLFGAVGIVLLVVCINLANMFLERSEAGRRDYAIRSALGGSRIRLVAELMTRNLMLCGIGGAAGLGLSFAGVEMLIAMGPADLPRLREVTVDWRVLLFTACVSILAGMVFSLIPALQRAGFDINSDLKTGGKSAGGGVRTARIRSGLIVVEVALSAGLLISAGLLVRSFAKLQSVDPGVKTRNLLLVRMSLPAGRYANREAVLGFLERLAADVRRTAAVESVSVASVIPLSGANTRADFTIIGRPPATVAETPAAQYRWVMPEYFKTIGISIIAGRDFTELDTGKSQPVVVVDQSLAERYFPGENPIGKHIRVEDSGPQPREVEIVGIVSSVKHFNLDDPPTPVYYSPVAQILPAGLGFLINSLNLVVRTDRDPLSTSESVRREIQSIDNEVAASTQTMDQLLAASVAPRRFNVLLIEMFAVAALMLAAIGLYSVIAYSVFQRRREIGIRIALGASARRVFGETIAEGMLLTAIGLTIGLAAAVLIGKAISQMLFNVASTDPMTFGAVALVLTATGVIASYLPARRATRVDPLIALRAEGP
jgi:predicted permease